MGKQAILVNLERCTGCWTCSLACKVGHDLPDEEFWLTVRTLGSGEGIDRPAGIWPDLHMSWIPVWFESCNRCPERLSEDEPPYCVYACPNSALKWGDEVPEAVEELREKGFRIFHQPSWDPVRHDITYASNGR